MGSYPGQVGLGEGRVFAPSLRVVVQEVVVVQQQQFGGVLAVPLRATALWGPDST